MWRARLHSVALHWGGVGALWASPAQIALLAVTGSHGPSARKLEARGADWQQLARDRRDMAEVAHQPSEPYQQGIARLTASQRREFVVRAGERGHGGHRGRDPQEPQGAATGPIASQGAAAEDEETQYLLSRPLRGPSDGQRGRKRA